jgi:diadenosine tetraphosphate (Ap4A) HIT family hydrolase
MSDSTSPDCPFCRLPPERVFAANSLAVAVADAYPSTGHTLIISRRHVASFFDLTLQEIRNPRT